MRILPVLAVSLISLIAAGPALADPSGFIAGSAGNSRFQNDNFSLSGPAINVRGSATQTLTPVLNIQGDVVLDYTKLVLDSDDYLENLELSGALHLFYREPELFAAGGFIQFDRQSSRIIDGNVALEPELSSRGIIGAEGQVYLDDVTLYGQVGYLKETFEGYAQGGFFATAQLRYFLTPDFKIDIHALASRVVHDDFSNHSLTTAGVGAGVEYRLPESPLSLFGSVDYYSVYSDGNPYLDETRVLVGLKFNFGSDSLKDQDRNGTSFNPYPNLAIRPVPVP